MPALPDHTKQICRTSTGGCMCDPEYHRDCEKLHKCRKYRNGMCHNDKDIHGITVPFKCKWTHKNEMDCIAYNDNPYLKLNEYGHLVSNYKAYIAGHSDAAPVPQYERGN